MDPSTVARARGAHEPAALCRVLIQRHTQAAGSRACRAWEEVEGCVAFTWQPVAVDVAVVRQAREIERRHRLSWWDCRISIAAALIQGCEVLLTEDLPRRHAYRRRLERVRNPFVHQTNEALAPYKRPHLRRGRCTAAKGTTREAHAVLV